MLCDVFFMNPLSKRLTSYFDRFKPFLRGKKIHADKTTPIGDICQTLRIPRETFCRYLAAA
jgi:hypothetical protein